MDRCGFADLVVGLELKKGVEKWLLSWDLRCKLVVRLRTLGRLAWILIMEECEVRTYILSWPLLEVVLITLPILPVGLEMDLASRGRKAAVTK